jgi:hypothetical protein
MAALQGLTPEAQKFTLLGPDTVLLPIQNLRNHITPEHPITAVYLPRPCSLPACEATSHPDSGCEFVSRANFIFSGTTPLLLGLINSPLEVAGSQVLDVEHKIVLFESAVTKQGIRELKLRTFEEVDGGKVARVTETVWGECPWYMAWVLRMVAPGVHREHMVSLLPYPKSLIRVLTR